MHSKSYLYWGFLSNLQPTDCAPIGLMQSWVRAHCTQGNIIFLCTVSVFTMKRASPLTIWRNKKFSESVWKYSNIFLWVKLDTGFMRSKGQAKKPFFFARVSYRFINMADVTFLSRRWLDSKNRIAPVCCSAS